MPIFLFCDVHVTEELKIGSANTRQKTIIFSSKAQIITSL